MDRKTKSRAPRDPQGRRNAIIDAAADILVREGIRNVTNRNVAERADVPLGSTTQHFKSIDELRYEALASVAQKVDKEYEKMFEQIQSNGIDADSIADALNLYLADSGRVQADAELYAVAIDDPKFRSLTHRLYDSFIKRCTPLIGDWRSEVLCTFVDGVVINACLTGEPMRPENIRKAIHIIMDDD